MYIFDIDLEIDMEGQSRIIEITGMVSDRGIGFVEIFAMGEWRSVCDDGWDLNAAKVVCREHGMLNDGEYITVTDCLCMNAL